MFWEVYLVIPYFVSKILLQSKLFDNSFNFKCRERLEHLTVAKSRLNGQDIVAPKVLSIHQILWSSTTGKSRLVVPSYHSVTIQVTTTCHLYHSHTQGSYQHELPSSYYSSYHTSYHSIHALFRAKVTSYHELQLIFLKK